MPIGAIIQRIGVANVVNKNAYAFGTNVLRLPSGFPVYQEQLVHSQANAEGPASAAAEWCGTADSEYQHSGTLREISAHDSQFARRNISDSPNYNLLSHRSIYTNQIYYVSNEPDAGSKLSIQGTGGGCSCWDPRDRAIDQHLSSCFPSPNTQFWDNGNPAGFTVDCGFGNYSRIQPDAMAYVYLRLKGDTENLGRGHIVIPPSSSSALLGKASFNGVPNPADEQYWVDFFDSIHNGVTVGNCSKTGITPSAMRAIHLHRYTGDPAGSSSLPLDFVAFDAAVIRAGVDWYRGTHGGGGALDLDILLSEVGFDWQIDSALRWAGGWSSFRLGLSWWNSYLCWLTRRASYECNLQGWSIGSHALHACIHEANLVPYTTYNPTSHGALLGQHNQWCLNMDTMQTGVLYNKQTIQINDLAIDQAPYPGTQIYQNSFLADTLNAINWDGKTWRTAPFGACYTVWAKVGADPVTTNLNTGWVYNTNQGIAGSATISLPSGYSTVLFAVIKDLGTFNLAQGSNINMKWIRSDGANKFRGHMSLLEFEDTRVIPIDVYSQTAFSAMVYPVVCYTSTPRTVTVELHRGLTGPGVWLSRPILLSGIYSWFITQ